MEKQYTKEEVIRITMNILSNISIPAALCKSIGMPIASAIENLVAVQRMMEQEKTAKEIAENPERNIVEGEDGRDTDAE